MQLCFFEDDTYTNFFPLTLTRPVEDLRTGILTLAEKWHYALDQASWSRYVRSELDTVFSSLSLDRSQSSLWINGRYLPSNNLVQHLKQLESGTCLKKDATIIAAYVDADTTAQWVEKGQPDFGSLLVVEAPDFPSVSHLWDLF